MAAAAAAGGSGDGGSRGGGWPVKKPHEQGMLNAKVKKRKAPVPRDRAQSGSPDSAVTTCPAMTPAALNGGGGVGGRDVDQEVQQPANRKRPRTPAAASGGHDVTEVQQQTNGKRPRLVWTTELHEIFVRACNGLEKEVVPKKILEAMKVTGLTRENVASHLQKYRQNMQGKGPAGRRRGNGGNGTVTMQHAAAPASLQPAFPQAHPPVAAAFPQAPSPSPTVNPPPTPPQGSFAVPNNMPQPQMGHVQLVQALPAALVHRRHQRHPDFPVLMQAPVPHHLFYQPPQFHQAAMQHRHRVMMEYQARHAARMNLQQAAVAPGHGHQNMVARNYELGAQTLARSAPAAASQAVNMSGGLCSVPEPGTGHEQTEARVGVAQLQQIAVVEAEGGQVPAAEAAFAGSADPDGGQQEDSCGVLQFWNMGSAPSMDHEFPPNKPI